MNQRIANLHQTVVGWPDCHPEALAVFSRAEGSQPLGVHGVTSAQRVNSEHSNRTFAHAFARCM
jgi:hypothetical protein